MRDPQDSNRQNIQEEIVEKLSIYPENVQTLIFETIKLVKEYSITDTVQHLTPLVRKLVKDEVEK